MDKAQKLYKEACSLLKNGEFKPALKNFRESARINPQFRPPFVRLGEIYSRAKRPDLALSYYAHALELSADSIVLFNLGSESYKLEAYENSIKYLRAAIKLDLKMIKAHLLLAFVYRKTNQLDKACLYFQNVRKLDKTNRMAYLGESIALVEMNDFEAAKKLITAYMGKTKVRDTAFVELLAGINLQTGSIDESYKDFQELTKTSKKFTNFTDHLSKARASQNQEFESVFEGLDHKISDKTKELKKRMAARKKHLESAKNLSANQNGIEGAMDLQVELKEDLRDMVDLSLMHLFNGDSKKAMQFLFQAKKMNNEHKE